jgi:DNA repair protein RecN (Recombination protein N)
VLAEVSRGRQVVCITHLPQIAAFADRHHRVQKRVAGGRTTSEVTPLGPGEARREEVARMLAGATVTEAALAHAGALIEAAQGASPGHGAERGAPSAGRRSAGGRAAARVAGAGR